MPVAGYFVELPLFFAGLTLGLTSSALASAGSAIIVTSAAGLKAGLMFILTQILPVLLIVRSALWSRTGENGVVEWYPPGLLLGRLLMLVWRS